MGRTSPWQSHGGTKIIREAMIGLIMAVFLGYLTLWILPGTHVYLKWFRQILLATNSPYFGIQGPMLLLYTFPILFIALLGCVYFHLGRKLSENSIERNGKKRYKFASWKRPMIIKGLGIVNWIELAIFIMFILLLVWSFTANLVTYFPDATRRAKAEGHKIWEGKLERVGLILGLVGNICLAFLFFPVTRGSSVLPVLGLTSEGSIKYHIWIGHLTMFLFTAHGFIYILYWLLTNQISHQVLEWDVFRVSNVAGELSLLFGLALWATTFPRIRRKMFEVFFYTHYMYILFMVFYVLHLGISYSYTVLPGFYLFLVDRFMRFLQSRQAVRLVSARVLPCQTVELNFSKTQALKYSPTSIIFINVPSISKLQWHPYTISSNSNLEADNLSVIVKNEGSWTQKLYQMLSSPSANNSTLNQLTVSVEGPYGPISTHFLRHDMLVMVSGGSGIAPFISIIRELIFTTTTSNPKTPKLLLIAAFKHSSDLSMIDLLLPISTPHYSDFSKLDLQIEAYVTRENEPPSIDKPKALQTIWFKPNDPSDHAPISPTLGPNGWLWLGTIISSSFIMFLIFMGILTRYYIYPIDHNTNIIYSHSSQALLNMLIICASIAVASTAAFLWNKREKTKQGEDHKDSWSRDDRELESLTHQSLCKTTNLHYGERPVLKRILLERKESSVGVLVCGPKEMRHEVAAICSSALAKNLHFESISFSW